MLPPRQRQVCYRWAQLSYRHPLPAAGRHTETPAFFPSTRGPVRSAGLPEEAKCSYTYTLRTERLNHRRLDLCIMSCRIRPVVQAMRNGL